MTSIRTGNRRRRRHQTRVAYYEGTFGINYVDANGWRNLEIIDVYGRNRTRGSRLRWARSLRKK